MADISSRGAKNHHTYKLTLSEASQSIVKNETTINYWFQLIDDGNWFWAEWNKNIAYSVSANGSEIASGYIPDHMINTQTIAMGSFAVPHNADGTKSISFSFSVTDGANQYYTSGNASASGSMTLTTIPRASTISAVTGRTIGGEVTVNIARAVSSFTHQMWYKVGNSDWYDLGNGIGTSKTFTIDIETAKQFPNSMVGSMELCVRTFNGTTQIGNDYYYPMTVTVPTYTPTIDSIKLTGNNLLSGEYVQGKSTVTVEISASSPHGANIKSYSSTVDGKTYTGNKFTSSALSNGSKTVSVTVTDTRGRTATLSSSAFTVYAYANPTITEFTLVRQSDGETVIATVKGSISAVNNKNAKTIQVTLNGVTQTITSSAYSINGTTTFTNVPTDNTLTAIAKITDSYTHATREFVLPTVAVTMDFLADGKGIAMGKVSETTDLLDVAWNERIHKDLTVDGNTKLNKAATISDTDWRTLALKRLNAIGAVTINFQNNTGSLGYIGMTGEELNSPLRRWSSDGATQYTVLDNAFVKDYIVDQGISGIWTYRKWNSGLAECWGVYTMTTAATKTWGSLYYSDTLAPRINYPFTFTSRPQESAFLHGSSVAGWVYPEAGGIGLNTTTQTGQYGFVRPTTIASSEVKYEYTVVGRWK